ncbi:glycoside hydrolase [Flammula alnicola]|nr:glycoside hydrolase [Flammula alnicola]
MKHSPKKPGFDTMFKSLLSLTLLSFLSISVRGHGYVQEIDSGSTKYTGYLPYQDPYYNPPPQRIVRQIPGNGPVTDLSLIDVTATRRRRYRIRSSALFATIAAGSQLALNWTTWPSSHMGPMITYLARAPSDITQWVPGTSAVWFKVAESGKTADGKWAATDLLTASNSIYTFTIPPKLKAGQYIHCIARSLHIPRSTSLSQLHSVQVTGSGTALPTSFVSFPGAYTASTPGIVYDAYQNTSAYPIPGPAIWTGGN